MGLGRRPLPDGWICGISQTEDLTCTLSITEEKKKKRKNYEGPEEKGGGGGTNPGRIEGRIDRRRERRKVIV